MAPSADPVSARLARSARFQLSGASQGAVKHVVMTCSTSKPALVQRPGSDAGVSCREIW